MDRGMGPFKVRYLIVAALAFVGFWLLRIATNSEEFDATAQFVALVVGATLFLVAAIALFRDYRAAPVADEVQIAEPTFAHFLFSSARSAPLWLGARFYLGYEWLDAGRHKLTDAAWMDGGAALQGYWERAVAIPEGGGDRRSLTASTASTSSTCSTTAGTTGSAR
ncbi:MAG: hypothetical protein AVDCRST_MAG19-2995 [uncultured Thermomicrobiales bacterium]|uniref:Uncharacterized protein n=1 Tax=uncultured Thermomicrobiales bacterium TaxID=1645740 RepID=A0A6J4V9Z9_9BACT|nr:MAG: hypothetical protein AVDCRST_MAG19-2995 [uncultured Thermomicrobiales bacterium]